MLTCRLARAKRREINSKSEIEINSKFKIQNSKPWESPDLIVIDGGRVNKRRPVHNS